MSLKLKNRLKKHFKHEKQLNRQQVVQFEAFKLGATVISALMAALIDSSVPNWVLSRPSIATWSFYDTIVS